LISSHRYLAVAVIPRRRATGLAPAVTWTFKHRRRGGM
jgi:hypothetical protein